MHAVFPNRTARANNKMDNAGGFRGSNAWPNLGAMVQSRYNARRIRYRSASGRSPDLRIYLNKAYSPLRGQCQIQITMKRFD